MTGLHPLVDARGVGRETDVAFVRGGTFYREAGGSAGGLGLHWAPLQPFTSEDPMANPPKGYHTVTPGITVSDGAKAIEFYKEAFGAEEVDRMPGPDGSIMHAEIRIGNSIIMLGGEHPAWGMKSPLTLGGVHGSLHIYVEDADAAFARAIDAGCEVTQPLEDAFWGDRYGKVTDPFGHQWGIATRVKELSREEMRNAAEAWMQTMSG